MAGRSDLVVDQGETSEFETNDSYGLWPLIAGS